MMERKFVFKKPSSASSNSLGLPSSLTSTNVLQKKLHMVVSDSNLIQHHKPSISTTHNPFQIKKTTAIVQSSSSKENLDNDDDNDFLSFKSNEDPFKKSSSTSTQVTSTQKPTAASANIMPYLSLQRAKKSQKKKSIDKDDDDIIGGGGGGNEDEDDIIKSLPKDQEDDDWNFTNKFKKQQQQQKSNPFQISLLQNKSNNKSDLKSSDIKSFFKPKQQQSKFNDNDDNEEQSRAELTNQVNQTKFKPISTIKPQQIIQESNVKSTSNKNDSDLLNFLPDCQPQPPSPKLPQASSLSNEEYLDSLFNKKKPAIVEPDDLILAMLDDNLTSKSSIKPIQSVKLPSVKSSSSIFLKVARKQEETSKTSVFVEDPDVCSTCNVPYDKATGARAARSEHQKLIDSCGHSICFSCLLSGLPCGICKHLSENKINNTSPIVNKHKTSDLKMSNKNFGFDKINDIDRELSDCFGQSLLNDDDDKNESKNSSISYSPKIVDSPPLRPTVVSSNNRLFENKKSFEMPSLTTKNSEKLFDLGAKLSKQFRIPNQEKAPIVQTKSGYSVPLLTLDKVISNDTNSSSSTNSSVVLKAPAIKKNDFVIVDSDSEDVIIEEDFLNSKPPKISIKSNNQLAKKTNQVKDDDFDYLFDEENTLDDCDAISIRSKPKDDTNNLNNLKSNKNFNFNNFAETNNCGDEDDTDDEIDEIDAELFKSSVFNKNQRSLSNLNKVDSNSKTFGVFIPELESYEKTKWLFNDIKDCSPYYRSLDYPHTELMLKSFREKFGLKQFRPQQFEAVNAALLGHNCFILMPTGGGKSLCYQLPAILSAGVTFVVSPLKSLIIDQVQKLNALNLTAAHLLSSENESGCEQVYQDLCRKEPTIRLVYVTPEKLNSSNKLMNILSNLYNRNMIARLVIDEAHCVSTWGHDFRKDYTQLGNLRNRLFPRVPAMLLTATATPRVRQDILVQMSLSCDESLFTNKNSNNNDGIYSNRHYVGSNDRQKCAFFIQSFNRENLIYQVEYKTSNNAALEKISTLIKTKFANKCGIVYCISRNECETVRDYLRSKQIKALAYHAGMNDKDRATIQNKWSNNIDCKVVCATIAFGMGIDKSDVRFVIHLGLPKSLEGYYQESGRAGRDGLVSTCLLFYNNQDRNKWLKLMKQEAKGQNYEVYKVHLDNLYRMSQYCDNRTDCRRTQILEYFGEIFDRNKCINSSMNTICDNCKSLQSNEFQLKDITEDSTVICRGVQKIAAQEDVTLLHLSEVLKGSMNSKITEKGHNSLEMHGKLAKYKKNDIERIIRKLIFDGYLKEEVKVLAHVDQVASYIKMGPKAYQLINYKAGAAQIKVEIDFREDDYAKKSAKAGENALDETQKSKKDTSDSSAENRVVQRCKLELKTLAKNICTQKGVKNVASVFSNKMLAEMLIQMPRTRDALLKITYYTEAIYDNYDGEEFLKIFQHYGKLIDEIREEEEKEKQAKAAAAAAAAAKKSTLSRLNSESKISNASKKNSKTYGLLDDDVFNDEDDNILAAKSIDYDFDRAQFLEAEVGAKSSWKSSKRRQSGSSTTSSWKSKKSKSNDGSSSYFANKQSSQGSSKFKAKKKFWKFKKRN